MTNATITFESIYGTVTVPLEEASFEEILQLRDKCNRLMAELDLEALAIP